MITAAPTVGTIDPPHNARISDVLFVWKRTTYDPEDNKGVIYICSRCDGDVQSLAASAVTTFAAHVLDCPERDALQETAPET